MKVKWTQKIAVVLAVVLCLTSFTGCGKEEASKGADQNASQNASQNGTQKGRYVEKELELPEGLAKDSIKKIFKMDDTLHLLTKTKEEDTMVFQEWEYKDGAFTEVTEEWMNQLKLPYLSYGVFDLLEDAEGGRYLCVTYADQTDGPAKGHLWKKESESTATEITPESWFKEVEDYGYFEYPENIVLLEGGVLAAKFYSMIQLINAEDGKVIKEIVPQAYYTNNIYALGNRFYLFQTDDTSKIKSVDVFETNQDAPIVSIPFGQQGIGNCYMDLLSDESKIIATADGIFKSKEDNNWEKLIDGMDTSMSRTDMWSMGTVALENGNIYIIYDQENGAGALMEYVYDPEAVSEVTTTLTLYTVNESSMLRQAAVLFHKKHPEVAINIEFTREKYSREAIDYSQLYQTLNAKLLAGEGADILVLDNLDLDSFSEKGLLLDINDIISPMEESNELLSNITSYYKQEDGKRYAVPLQFSLMLLIGRDIDITQMQDVAGMAQVLSTIDESLMGPLTPEELVTRFSPYFMNEIIDGKELNKEALKKNLEYLKAISDNSGLQASRGEEERAWGIWDIASRAKLAFSETDGFWGAMLPIAAANLVKGDYKPFADSFFPKLQVGINSKSENVEVAKEFLAFLLSSEIQQQEYYEGFPINAKAMEYLAYLDRSDMSSYTTIEMADGIEEGFEISSFSEEDAKKLVDTCKKATKAAIIDEKVQSEITQAIAGYLDGSQTIEDTITKIEGGLKMYLAE